MKNVSRMNLNRTFKASLLSILTVAAISRAFAGDGHDHGSEENTIPSGSVSVNGVNYVDLGEWMNIGPYRLSKVANKATGIHYHDSRSITPLSPVPAGPWSLEILEGSLTKLSKASVITFTNVPVSIQEPTLSNDGMVVKWSSAADKAFRAEVVLETMNGAGQVIGRIVLETTNSGEAVLPAAQVSLLPRGTANLAVKVISATAVAVGEGKDLYTVFSVNSQVKQTVLQ